MLRFSVRKRFAGLRPEGTMRSVSLTKKRAKVLHFFEMTKYFGIFFTLRCVFLSKTPNIPVPAALEWGLFL